LTAAPTAQPNNALFNFLRSFLPTEAGSHLRFPLKAALPTRPTLSLPASFVSGICGKPPMLSPGSTGCSHAA